MEFSLKDFFSSREAVIKLIHNLIVAKIYFFVEIVLAVISFIFPVLDFSTRVNTILILTGIGITLGLVEFSIKWRNTLERIIEERCREKIEALAKEKGCKINPTVTLEITPDGGGKRSVDISILPIKPVETYDIRYFSRSFPAKEGKGINILGPSIFTQNRIKISQKVLGESGETTNVRYFFKPPLQPEWGWVTIRLPQTILPDKTYLLDKKEFDEKHKEGHRKHEYNYDGFEVINAPYEEITHNVLLPDGFNPLDWEEVHQKSPWVSEPSKEPEFEKGNYYDNEKKRLKITKSFVGNKIQLSLKIRYPFMPASYNIMWKPQKNFKK